MTSFAHSQAAIVEARPTPTPEQHEQARRYVAQHAPDLLAAIFGDETKEN